MDYDSFVAEVARLAKVKADGAEYLANIPFAIEYAEGRIYRELDMILQRTAVSTSQTVAGTRNITLPATILVVEGMNCITPAGISNPDDGTRVPMTNVSRDWLDAVYPSMAAENRGVPRFFDVFTNTTAILGPCPDAVYNIEVKGTFQPSPMSASNTQPTLVALLPDVYLAAAMIQVAGWQKNYGGQSDDPAQAQSWESQYGLLMASAQTVEMRKKFESQGWTSKTPTPLAKPRD